jgi:hypothetical protein
MCAAPHWRRALGTTANLKKLILLTGCILGNALTVVFDTGDIRISRVTEAYQNQEWQAYLLTRPLVNSMPLSSHRPRQPSGQLVRNQEKSRSWTSPTSSPLRRKPSPDRWTRWATPWPQLSPIRQLSATKDSRTNKAKSTRCATDKMCKPEIWRSSEGSSLTWASGWKNEWQNWRRRREHLRRPSPEHPLLRNSDGLPNLVHKQMIQATWSKRTSSASTHTSVAGWTAPPWNPPSLTSSPKLALDGRSSKYLGQTSAPTSPFASLTPRRAGTSQLWSWIGSSDRQLHLLNTGSSRPPAPTGAKSSTSSPRTGPHGTSSAKGFAEASPVFLVATLAEKCDNWQGDKESRTEQRGSSLHNAQSKEPTSYDGKTPQKWQPLSQTGSKRRRYSSWKKKFYRGGNLGARTSSSSFLVTAEGEIARNRPILEPAASTCPVIPPMQMLSWNMRGATISRTERRAALRQLMQKWTFSTHVMCFQETHGAFDDQQACGRLFQATHRCYSSPTDTAAAGGLIILIDRHTAKEIEFQILVPGRVATLSFLWMDKSQVTIANVHNYGFPERTLHQNLDVCLRLPHPTFVLGDLNLCSERAAAELTANSTNK